MPSRYKWDRANDDERVRKYVPKKKYLYSEIEEKETDLTDDDKVAKLQELLVETLHEKRLKVLDAFETKHAMKGD